MKYWRVAIVILGGCGPSDEDVSFCEQARAKVVVEAGPALSALQTRLAHARALVSDEQTVADAKRMQTLQRQLSDAEQAGANARGQAEDAYNTAMKEVVGESVSAGRTGPLSEAERLEIYARAERLSAPSPDDGSSDGVIRQAKDILGSNQQLLAVAHALDLVPEYEELQEQVRACTSSWETCSLEMPYQDQDTSASKTVLWGFNYAVAARAKACRGVLPSDLTSP
jgi:hypothetical protein